MKPALGQKAGDRSTFIDVDASPTAGPPADSSTAGPSHPPPAPTRPSNSPASRPPAYRGAVQVSQTPAKRGLPSTEGARHAKLSKIASPTPVRPARQETRDRGQLAAAKAGPAKMRAEDPWARYRKVYEIMIDDFTTVAIRKDKSYEPVIVRSFREDRAPTTKTKRLHEIRHENLLALLESFSFEGYRYLILERVSVSLVEVVASPHYPTVHELTAVLGQVSPGCVLHGI